MKTKDTSGKARYEWRKANTERVVESKKKYKRKKLTPQVLSALMADDDVPDSFLD